MHVISFLVVTMKVQVILFTSPKKVRGNILDKKRTGFRLPKKYVEGEKSDEAIGTPRTGLGVSEKKASEPTHDGPLTASVFVTGSLFLTFVDRPLPLRQARPPSVVI